MPNHGAVMAALPRFQQRQWIKDYFAHMREDPRQAEQLFSEPSTTGVGAREGSGRNLKARTIPTYADGIAAGLKPPSVLEAEASRVATKPRSWRSPPPSEVGR